MQWDRVYPTEQAASDLLRELLNEVAEQPGITVYTRAEIVEARGCVGDFQLTVKRQPRGVDDTLSPEELGMRSTPA